MKLRHSDTIAVVQVAEGVHFSSEFLHGPPIVILRQLGLVIWAGLVGLQLRAGMDATPHFSLLPWIGSLLNDAYSPRAFLVQGRHFHLRPRYVFRWEGRVCSTNTVQRGQSNARTFFRITSIEESANFDQRGLNERVVDGRIVCTWAGMCLLVTQENEATEGHALRRWMGRWVQQSPVIRIYWNLWR